MASKVKLKNPGCGLTGANVIRHLQSVLEGNLERAKTDERRWRAWRQGQIDDVQNALARLRTGDDPGAVLRDLKSTISGTYLSVVTLLYEAHTYGFRPDDFWAVKDGDLVRRTT